VSLVYNAVMIRVITVFARQNKQERWCAVSVWCDCHLPMYAASETKYNTHNNHAEAPLLSRVSQHAMHTERDIVMANPSVRPSVQCRYCD